MPSVQHTSIPIPYGDNYPMHVKMFREKTTAGCMPCSDVLWPLRQWHIHRK
jgi:hypothetical protein